MEYAPIDITTTRIYYGGMDDEIGNYHYLAPGMEYQVYGNQINNVFKLRGTWIRNIGGEYSDLYPSRNKYVHEVSLYLTLFKFKKFMDVTEPIHFIKIQ
jgi:hypothetical protein